MRLLALLLSFLLTQEPLTGVATYYADGIMNQVIGNRIAWGQITPCQECIGNVALENCQRLDSRIWIEWLDDEVIQGPYRVVDCAAQRDLVYLHRIRFVVDVSWKIAQIHNMRGPVPVKVWLEPVPVLGKMGGCQGIDGAIPSGNEVVPPYLVRPWKSACPLIPKLR